MALVGRAWQWLSIICGKVLPPKKLAFFCDASLQPVVGLVGESQQWSALLEQATQASEGGDHTRAIQICEQICAQSRSPHAQALAILGISLAATGSLSLSIDRLREAIALGADSLETQHALGAALNAMGYSEAAEAALLRALDFAPDSAVTWGVLAGVYRRGSRLDDALRALQKAISIDPDNHSFRAELATCLLQGCEWVALSAARQQLREEMNKALSQERLPSIPPLLALCLGFSAAEMRQLACSQAFCKEAAMPSGSHKT